MPTILYCNHCLLLSTTKQVAEISYAWWSLLWSQIDSDWKEKKQRGEVTFCIFVAFHKICGS